MKILPAAISMAVAFAAIALLASCYTAPTTPEVKIVRLDPTFDKFVPADARVEKLADGYSLAEGPVWNRKEKFLLFSDMPNNQVVKWEEGKGASQFLKPSGYTGAARFDGGAPGSNGLAYDPQGRLLLCQHGDRRIARLEADGKFTTIVDRYEGKRLNSPNDLVFTTNGDLYFTDPPYGLPKGMDDPACELDFCGVYRLSKDGKLALLTKEIARPNGIALSPDEKKLYVASSDADKAVWMVYDVMPDGTIANGKVFFDATAWIKEGRKGLPDGMKVDQDGNLFATGPGGVLVFSPEGKHVGTFDTGMPTTNVGWGDDGSTLYITTVTALLRIKLNTKGLGF